jgi:hypothetical protein
VIEVLVSRCRWRGVALTVRIVVGRLATGVALTTWLPSMDEARALSRGDSQRTVYCFTECTLTGRVASRIETCRGLRADR